jgi:glycosyltransferase involved in cell wall biosynthesis
MGSGNTHVAGWLPAANELNMNHAKEKLRILVLVPYYRPGFKGGGPIASLEALVAQPGGEFSWTIATADRDYGDADRYPNIPADGCLHDDNLVIHYLKPGLGRLFRVAWLLRQDDYDLLYLNDMFSPCWGVWPLWLHRLGWLKGKPALVAPRNQFSRGALGIKRFKKRLFLRVARWGGLWRGIRWQATCAEESKEIFNQAGASARMWIAPVFPNVKILSGEAEPASVTNGSLRIVFFSRISPMKNLECALSVLGGLSFPIQFDVAGPADNDAYLREVKASMAQLPGNISTTYLGPIKPQHVDAFLASYDAMLLPTRGENFGHVILEALAAGCPPIISDRTPWKDLKEKGCGWVVPLEDEDGFRQALLDLKAMAPEERQRMRAAARAYARSYIETPEVKALNLKMFREVLNQAGRDGRLGSA